MVVNVECLLSMGWISQFISFWQSAMLYPTAIPKKMTTIFDVPIDADSRCEEYYRVI